MVLCSRAPLWPGWLRRCMELRIDVGPRAPDVLQSDLARLRQRIHTPGESLYGMASEPLDDPAFRLHHRTADGEWYVYIEDVAQARLAGTTVFNRLVEVGRRADPWVRAPHSQYDAPYRRRGLARAVYRRALDSGMCLLSGARQSDAAHALWLALSRDYPLWYVDVRHKRLRCLGDTVTPAVRDGLHTRMLLLAPGWSVQRFADAAGMAR